MKILVLLSFTFLMSIQIKVLSQPCLPEGISFWMQEQIDNFQTNYPNCNQIEGFVSIQGDDIYNLNGLSHVNSIGGVLHIFGNPSLTSLAGLEGLTAVGGNLLIGGFALTSLTGLGSLTSIGGDLTIMSNDVLPDLSGLNSLTYIGDSLFIFNNPVLTSLTGLDNLDAGSFSNLIITGNSNLSSCDVQSICDYLASPHGRVEIQYNAPGCNNPPEVASGCGITLPCLPFGNYYFATQADIDNFQANYPDCKELEGEVAISGSDITNLNGLSVLTSVSGSLSLGFSDALSSLTGLEGLTTVEGDFEIVGNNALTSLTGLEGLTTVGGYLMILYQDSLASLTGLEGLTSIGGSLQIMKNGSLATLTGLGGLTSIGGDVEIDENFSLASLTGLEGLNAIGGNLIIGGHFGTDQGNYSLVSLTGLNNLVSIGGDLDISQNQALTSIMELEDLTSIGGDLWIIQDNSLSSCAAVGICDHLSNPGGMINIYDNAPGCNSIIEVAAACGGSVPCLPYGNYYFASQADIDNFQQAFQECTELEGDVTICGSDIINLNGLNAVTSFGGSLRIFYNSALTTLTGLGDLSIGGSLSIYGNAALINLTGLEGLSSVGGLNIGISTRMGGVGNPSLTSLTGLEGLTTIDGGHLVIKYNPILSSLTGLDNVEAGSVSYLEIYSNGTLATCVVQSVCDYLVSPNGTIEIHDNATGCDSQEEVEAACEATFVEDLTTESSFSIYSNPALIQITIETSTPPQKNTLLTIYNLNGQQIIQRQVTEQTTVIDVGVLPSGVYVVRMVWEKGVQVGKFVKK